MRIRLVLPEWREEPISSHIGRERRGQDRDHQVDPAVPLRGRRTGVVGRTTDLGGQYCA